jgi:hypothetical protein
MIALVTKAITADTRSCPKADETASDTTGTIRQATT